LYNYVIFAEQIIFPQINARLGNLTDSGYRSSLLMPEFKKRKDLVQKKC